MFESHHPESMEILIDTHDRTETRSEFFPFEVITGSHQIGFCAVCRLIYLPKGTRALSQVESSYEESKILESSDWDSTLLNLPRVTYAPWTPYRTNGLSVFVFTTGAGKTQPEPKHTERHYE